MLERDYRNSRGKGTRHCFENSNFTHGLITNWLCTYGNHDRCILSYYIIVNVWYFFIFDSARFSKNGLGLFQDPHRICDNNYWRLLRSVNIQYDFCYGRRNRIINEGNANRAGHVVVLILWTVWVDPRDTRSAGGIALKASFGSARTPHFSSVPLASRVVTTEGTQHWSRFLHYDVWWAELADWCLWLSTSTIGAAGICSYQRKHNAVFLDNTVAR